jgi:CRP/FNR family cyclic AMP-dependent transcriptional regulator
MAERARRTVDGSYLTSPGVAYALTTVRERMDMIARADWAADLEWGEVVRIAQFFDACTVKAGTVVFREGDREAYMCLLISGQVEVRKRTNAQTERVISTIERGKTFGEMSLIDGQPRSATVLASEDSTVLVLTKHNFARLTEECPRLVLRMVLRMHRQLSQHLRNANVTLVEHLDS